MNASRQQYLQSIRAETAYPVYRGVIGTIALLGYVLAGVIALGALVTGLGAMASSFLTGLITLVAGGVVAAITFLVAKLSKEASLMLADIADSTVDANSRVLSSLPR
jgi:hypothetical protein